MKIINRTKNTTVASNAVLADSLFARLKGLLGTKELKKGQALILNPCNSIHTFFMHYPIDVIFVSKDNVVVKTISCIKPFRLSSIYFKAKYAIELPVDTIRITATSKGDTLLL